MESKIANAIALTNHPVALVWADAAPEGAVSFKPGRWGCVMSLFAAAAAKGRVGAFDCRTYGCWGGGADTERPARTEMVGHPTHDGRPDGSSAKADANA